MTSYHVFLDGKSVVFDDNLSFIMKREGEGVIFVPPEMYASTSEVKHFNLGSHKIMMTKRKPSLLCEYSCEIEYSGVSVYAEFEVHGTYSKGCPTTYHDPGEEPYVEVEYVVITSVTIGDEKTNVKDGRVDHKFGSFMSIWIRLLESYITDLLCGADPELQDSFETHLSEIIFENDLPYEE